MNENGKKIKRNEAQLNILNMHAYNYKGDFTFYVRLYMNT